MKTVRVEGRRRLQYTAACPSHVAVVMAAGEEEEEAEEPPALRFRPPRLAARCRLLPPCELIAYAVKGFDFETCCLNFGNWFGICS